MLTHELRTPIAQLSNVVEHFRRDFDRLPEGAQLNFVALADTLQRMRQMADTSKHYLIAGDSQRVLSDDPAIGYLKNEVRFALAHGQMNRRHTVTERIIQ